MKKTFLLIYLTLMDLGCIFLIGVIILKIGFTLMGIALIVVFAIIGLLTANILRLWFTFNKEIPYEQVIYKDVIFFKRSDNRYCAYDGIVWYDSIVGAYQNYIFTHMEELIN